MMDEFNEITKWIESCNIPIELNHWDFVPKNLLYDEETETVTIVDYELANPDLFAHDIGKYFLGFLGDPFDFNKYPNEARRKQFVKFYLEEKWKLLGKPLSEITEDFIEKVFYWSELCYMFTVFFYGLETAWWKAYAQLEESPISADDDLFTLFTEPCMKEYYRMKERLLQKRDK